MTIQGIVVDVTTQRLGTTLFEDAQENDTILVVADVFDFDEDGGQLELDIYEDTSLNPILSYVSIVEDNGDAVTTDEGEFVLSEIHLDPSTPVPLDLLEVGVEQIVPVYIYPAGEETLAEVIIDDDQYSDAGADTGDNPTLSTITARFNHATGSLIKDGMRNDITGYDSVILELEDDEWVITEILGKSASIDGSDIDPDSQIPREALTDGEPPEFAPVIAVAPFAVGSVRVSWPAVSNADPVRYQVYASTSSGVTIDPLNLIDVTSSTSIVFNSINGVNISTTDPTYVVVVPEDDDGEGPTSNEANATARKVSLPDLAQDISEYFDELDGDIQEALTAANGKNKIFRSSSDASSGTPGTATGDVWYKITNDNVEAMWIWDGTVWQVSPLEHTAIASLDAGKISVGILNADRIAANSISTEKLLIGDLSNSVEDGRFSRDPSVYFTSQGTWDFGAETWTFPVGVGNPWGGVSSVAQLEVTDSLGGWLWIRPKEFIPTSQGDVWFFSFYVRKTSTGTTGTISLAYDTGDSFPFPATSISLNDLVQDEWVKITTQWTVNTSTITKVRIAFWSIDIPIGETLQFTDFIMRRANTGELLVDGSIKANHIFGTTVEADVITGNLLYVGDIQANQITTGILSAQVTISGSVKTAETGQRIELNPGGLYAYNATEETAHLSADTGGLQLDGTLTVSSSGQIIAGGDENFIQLSTLSVGEFNFGYIDFFGIPLYEGYTLQSVGKMTGTSGPAGTNGISIIGMDRLYLGNREDGEVAINPAHMLFENGNIYIDAYPGTFDLFADEIDLYGNNVFTIRAVQDLTLESEGFNVQTISGNAFLVYTGGETVDRAFQVSAEGNVSLPRHITTTNSANVYMTASAGQIRRVSSLREHKLFIKDIEVGEKDILDLPARVWKDRSDYENWSETKELPEPRWIPGFVVDEVEDSNLSVFVSYDEYGEPVGVLYDRIVAAIIPYLNLVESRLQELEG